MPRGRSVGDSARALMRAQLAVGPSARGAPTDFDQYRHHRKNPHPHTAVSVISIASPILIVRITVSQPPHTRGMARNQTHLARTRSLLPSMLATWGRLRENPRAPSALRTLWPTTNPRPVYTDEM